jgi:hypothetical protein
MDERHGGAVRSDPTRIACLADDRQLAAAANIAIKVISPASAAIETEAKLAELSRNFI